MRFLRPLAVGLALLTAGEAAAEEMRVFSYGGDVHVTFSLGGSLRSRILSPIGVGVGFDWRLREDEEKPFATLAVRAEVPRLRDFRLELLAGGGHERFVTSSAPSYAGGEGLAGLAFGTHLPMALLGGGRAYYQYGPLAATFSAIGSIAMRPHPFYELQLGWGLGLREHEFPASEVDLLEDR